MDEQTKVKWVKIEKACDVCGEGKMIVTGVIYSTSPPRIEHKCNKCGKKRNYERSYPCFVPEDKI